MPNSTIAAQLWLYAAGGSDDVHTKGETVRRLIRNASNGTDSYPARFRTRFTARRMLRN